MMIRAQDLTKRYGRTVAIEGLTFSIKRGEIVGFLGPNGAGKTTTMRILAGYLPASGGEAEVAGADVFTESMLVRQQIGYLPEHVPLYGDMRVREYLRYRGRLKGLRHRQLKDQIKSVAEQCSLENVMDRLIGHLSKGYRQRVGLADALLHDPAVLILDEPTIGLDPNQIRHIRELIRGLANQYTVVLSSHILHEVEMICGRVLIMNRGRIVASDSPDNLRGMLKGNVRGHCEIRGPRWAVIKALESIPGIEKVTCVPDGEWSLVSFECQADADVRESVYSVAVKEKWMLRELRLERQNLEDVFTAITEGGLEPDASDATPAEEEPEE